MIKSSLSWQDELRAAVSNIDGWSYEDTGRQDIESVIRRYPMRITPYFSSLIKNPSDALARQVLPDIRELADHLTDPDPLNEAAQSPVPGLVHRYPDRVLFLVSNQCAVYCRYCMRKRMVGNSFQVNDQTRETAIEYIRQTPSVHEVILSGGDPLLLSTGKLDEILTSLRLVPHIEVIRIHSRTPGVLPSRITGRLTEMLKHHQPLYINIQFNHPDEITPQSAAACTKLADAGIPLGSQTVLLKGVNDDPEIMIRLMRRLLGIRVKPYYLHHPDVVKGTGHFRTGISCGLRIMEQLRGRISGMAVPQYMIDLPGGGGKIPLVPNAVSGEAGGKLKVKGLGNRIYEYPKD